MLKNFLSLDIKVNFCNLVSGFVLMNIDWSLNKAFHEQMTKDACSRSKQYRQNMRYLVVFVIAELTIKLNLRR